MGGDIYPWYDEERWFKERFKGDPVRGRHVLQNFCFEETQVYFRHSYGSLRVRGFEYAVLKRNGTLRYGQKNRRLYKEKCLPQEVVSALSEMFLRLADSNSEAPPVERWAASLRPPRMADFINYATKSHQAEHWLESELLRRPSVLCSSFEQARSQVVVGYKGRRGWSFIDLIVLDRQNHEIVVVELKLPKATGGAVKQIRKYAEWVKTNIHRLLRPDYGYFPGVQDPVTYRVAIAFVAPQFNSNFASYINDLLPYLVVRTFQINSDWRKTIRVEQIHEYPAEAPTIGTAGRLPEDGSSNNMRAKIFGVSHRWQNDQLTCDIIRIAAEYGLKPQFPEKQEYINLKRASDNVAVQIHKRKGQHSGRALAIGNAEENCPISQLLEGNVCFDELSGDTGRNKLWLRSEGKTFGHRKPARVFFLQNNMASAENTKDACWSEVRALINYSIARAKRHTMAAKSDSNGDEEPTSALGGAISITHGDVDGMVCAAQIIHREKGSCEVLFSNARLIANKLEQVVKRDSFPERLYVTDIPANSRAVDCVGKLTTAGVKVYWIDHHPLPENGLIERLRGVCRKFIYNEATSTPAGILLSEWLGEEEPYYRRIGKICYAYKKGTSWERNWFRLLAGHVGKAERGMLERLAFDRPFTDEDLLDIERQKAAEILTDKILSEKPQVVVTADGKRLAVYDTSGQPGVFLGQKVFRRHDVDYCIIRITERKWQIAANHNRSLSLRRLAGLHDIEGLKVRLAGRPDRLLSAEVIPPQPVPQDAQEHLVAWAQGLL